MVAARESLYKAGIRNVSKVVSMLSSASAIASKMIKSLDYVPKTPIPYTRDEVLALFLDESYRN